jgi:hypothetical protein
LKHVKGKLVEVCVGEVLHGYGGEMGKMRLDKDRNCKAVNGHTLFQKTQKLRDPLEDLKKGDYASN